MSRHRVTIDEISPDRYGEHLATLVDDEGRSVVLPADLLPADARIGDVLTLTLERDVDETTKRVDRVASLQQRLFGRGKGPTEG